MGGCTSCGAKQRCDSRKGEMFEAIDATLLRLYPSRRWGEVDDDARFGAGIGNREGRALAKQPEAALSAATLYKPGSEEEFCDYIYILCRGRTPSLLEIREQALPLPAELAGAQSEPIQELYLRLCLSNMARMAGVQQVAVDLDRVGG